MTIDVLIEKYSKPSILQLAGTNISIVETGKVKSDLLQLKEDLKNLSTIEGTNPDVSDLIKKYEKANRDYARVTCYKEFLSDLKSLPTIEYSRKEKLPRVLANFVEELKNTNKRYGIFLEETFQNTKDSDLANYLSMNENIEKVFKAISNGYEVEEEPKYYVKVGEKLYFKSWGEDGQSPEFIIDCHFYSKQGAYVCDSKEIAQKIASEVGGTVEEEGTK